MPINAALIAILSVLALAVAVLVFSIRRLGARGRDLETRFEASSGELSGALNTSLERVSDELRHVTSLVNDQLSSVTHQLQASAGQINTRMDNAAKMVGAVNQNLGELKKATEQLFEIGRNITGLEDILKAPKLRGGLGELFLGDLLSQCLPKRHYDLQYTFRNGSRVDAVLRLAGGLVPVDSKFPLENFRRIIDGATDEEKRGAKKRFINDCKRHIDAIASSYILPEEGTLNFALMYIPAENVYYETIVGETEEGGAGGGGGLAGYAFSKKVVPVSPNSFYAYLQTVLVGLKGIEVSREAGRILKHLERLRNDFDAFLSDFETLGRHINNTKARYDTAMLKAAKHSSTLGGLTGEADSGISDQAPAPSVLPPEGPGEPEDPLVK
jgi:DNA recombination protein RmuC